MHFGPSMHYHYESRQDSCQGYLVEETHILYSISRPKIKNPQRISIIVIIDSYIGLPSQNQHQNLYSSKSLLLYKLRVFVLLIEQVSDNLVYLTFESSSYSCALANDQIRLKDAIQKLKNSIHHQGQIADYLHKILIDKASHQTTACIQKEF